MSDIPRRVSEMLKKTQHIKLLTTHFLARQCTQPMDIILIFNLHFPYQLSLFTYVCLCWHTFHFVRFFFLFGQPVDWLVGISNELRCENCIVNSLHSIGTSFSQLFSKITLSNSYFGTRLEHVQFNFCFTFFLVSKIILVRQRSD